MCDTFILGFVSNNGMFGELYQMAGALKLGGACGSVGVYTKLQVSVNLYKKICWLF